MEVVIIFFVKYKKINAFYFKKILFTVIMKEIFVFNLTIAAY